MKINLIVPSFYPATVYGGPIFSTLHACEALSKLEDVEIYVSTTNANRDSKLEVQANVWLKFSESFFVKYYNETKIDKFSIALFLNLWKDIKSSKIVYLQGVFGTPTPMALIYAFVFRKPVLISPRGSFCKWGLAQGSRFKKIWMKLFINPFENHVHWHATSLAEKNDILNLFPKSQVHIIANGIDLSSFSNDIKLEKDIFMQSYLGKKMRPSKIIVSMGRIHKVKGFDILIKAFSEVIKLDAKSVLLIAGKDVGEKKKLLTLVKFLSLENSVFFVGEVSGQAKINFLANADLFVLPSHTENFGNVYVESLAAGTPIVASKGTPWEEVENANCGKWVENTVKETYNAILNILEKDREEMRLNARKLAKKYDWKNIAVKFKDVFNQIGEN